MGEDCGTDAPAEVHAGIQRCGAHQPTGLSPEKYPGPAALDAAACRGYLSQSLTSYSHPAGTCKIGTDAVSMVDAELKVHGLRVAVMPSPVSANTNATVLAVAERPASMLTTQYPWRPAISLAARNILGGPQYP